MAILTQSNSGSGDGPITGWSIQQLAKPGPQVAVCLAVKDTLNYETPTYDDPTVMEVKDVTRFLFGLSDGSMVQTSEMKISGHEKSKLFKMLVSWLGHPPAIGFDTESLVGKGVTLNIITKVSKKGREYSDPDSVAPVMPDAQIPNVASFTIPGGNPQSAPAQPVAPVQPVQQVAPAQVATTMTVDQPQTVVQPVQQPVQQVQPVQQPAQGQQTLGGQFTPPPSESVPF